MISRGMESSSSVFLVGGLLRRVSAEGLMSREMKWIFSVGSVGPSVSVGIPRDGSLTSSAIFICFVPSQLQSSFGMEARILTLVL